MKDYLRHKILNVINIKGLTALEFLDLEGKYKNYEEFHDFWEICYVKSGEVTLCIDEKSLKLSKNQLLIIPPNHTHYYVSTDSTASAFVICFESVSNILNPLSMVRFNLKNEQIYCLERIIFESENTFKMNDDDLLEVLASPNFGGKQAILLQLEYLLICLARQLSSEANCDLVFLSDKNFYADFVGVVISFLSENVRERVSLNDICDRMKCSRSFLCKVFKSQTGKTIFSYFNQMKIEEATNMLTETDMSISDIAYSLGFSETKYFDYLFKKYIGETPKAFKKRVKKS